MDQLVSINQWQFSFFFGLNDSWQIFLAINLGSKWTHILYGYLASRLLVHHLQGWILNSSSILSFHISYHLHRALCVFGRSCWFFIFFIYCKVWFTCGLDLTWLVITWTRRSFSLIICSYINSMRSKLLIFRLFFKVRFFMFPRWCFQCWSWLFTTFLKVKFRLFVLLLLATILLICSSST